MGRFIDKDELTRAGDRPVLGPVLTGLAGILGGYLIGRLGGWVALTILGPLEPGDPMDFFGNAIRLLVPMMVFGAGVAGGFLVGTVVLPTILMLGLAWNEAGRTVGYLLFLLLAVVPVTVVLLLQVGSADSSGSTEGALWFAVALVGGLTPAAARRLAIRSRPDGSTRRPSGQAE